MRQAPFALFALFAVCAGRFAHSQDPAAGCAVALLRQDPVAAAQAAGQAATPASRARLQAALVPLAQRPAAMLAVAQTFAAEPDADQALLAGSAAVLLLLLRSDPVPGLQVWAELTHEHSRYAIETDDLVPVVLGLRAAVTARQQRGGDARLLGEAARLLDLATVSRFGLWPARIARGATWQRPEGLAEDLQLRVLPCPPGHLAWDRVPELTTSNAPAWQGVLPHRGEVNVPPLPPGNWLLEVRSAAGPWRGVRTIEVAELDAVALAVAGTLVLAAFDRVGPAAVSWQLRAADQELAQGSTAKGPVIVAWPPAGKHESNTRELLLRGDAGDAWLEIEHGAVHEPWRTAWVAHGMVDRPLYRPGETVQGRVVLRSCTWRGEGLAVVPGTAIAAEQPLRVVVDLGVAGKQELAGRSDAHGVFAFTFRVPEEVPPGTWLDFTAVLPAPNEHDEPVQVGLGTLCGVASFRRAAVRLRVDGPEEVPPGTGHVEVAATAEWASGGPAAGLDVRVHVSTSGTSDLVETHDLRTGDDGRIVVRVPMAALGITRASFDFAATGPDGQISRGYHRCDWIAPEQTAAKPDPDDRWRKRLALDVGPAVVGAACRVSARGAPKQHAVLVVGRGPNVRAQAVQFDATGRVHVDVPVQTADWPRLDVTVATRTNTESAEAAVALRTVRAPTITLPDVVIPGSDVEVRIDTDAPRAIVTVAVVDERIFELEPDRTPDPDEALRPAMPDWRWGDAWAPPDSSPAELVGSMLRRGRVPPIDEFMRDLSRIWWAGGSGGPSGSVAGGLRADFRATAAFVTVVADEHGAATMRFRLPSDLTRWRLTALGIDPAGTGFVATRTLATRQPLAAEPVLPRGVRAGDEFALPISIDRAADATASADTVQLTVAFDGAAMQVVDAPATLPVPAGRVGRTVANVRATAAGTTKLSLGVALASYGDRSQRDVAIGRDAVVRPLRGAASGSGELVVPLPEGTSPDAGLTVDVLLGGASAWRRIEADLAAYPHGCAEQTLSRLVPYFAMVRAAGARGDTPPAMDAGFRRRLIAGLHRLRELQDPRGGFAFWPGGEPDPGITALALHWLALLRDGGFDPARAGLRLGRDDPLFRDYTARPFAREPVVDAAFVQSAELVVAAARFLPADQSLQQSARPLLELLPRLPAGLCARLGLARHAGGDAEGARRCLERLTTAATPALAADGFPGEDPLAVQALRLELMKALGADATQVEAGAADLLLGCLQGRGSTYAHAAALAALARVLPCTPDVSATIEVRAGASVRTFALGGKDGDVAHWRLPRAAAVTVRGPAGVPLLVRLTTERTEPAAGHAAWQAPLHVERELCAPPADHDWQRREAASGLTPLATPPIVGRPLVLRLRVRAPVPMRFVVVECPLPAGFELADAPPDVDRHDDRFVFTCDLAAGVANVRTFAVVPTVAGRVLWPPTTAAPMYASELDGGTAGAFVTVVAPPAGSVPSLVTCFAIVPPPPPEPVADALDDFVWALYGAWKRDDDEVAWDEAASQREVETLLANVPTVADRWRWLTELTSLFERLDRPDPADARPETQWRVTATATLQALLHTATLEAFDLPLSDTPEAAANGCAALTDAVGNWPSGEDRELALARLLARARATAKSCLVDVLQELDTPPRAAVLLHELRTCLADPDPEVRSAAFAALPAEQRASLPPAVVIAAQPAEFAPGVIRLLAASEAGRVELRVRLRNSDFVLRQRDLLASELPAGLWRELSLPALQELAGIADDDDEVLGPAHVATLVAAGAFPTTELQQAMAAAVDPAWRAVVARALQQRGITQASPDTLAGDLLWPLWCRALALGPADATAALAVLDALAPQPSSRDLGIEQELLAAFALPPVVAAGTPAQLYAARAAMKEAAWRAAWARLDARARVDLLDLFTKYIGTTFVPVTAIEAEAIWRFLLRGGEVDDAVATLTSSAIGFTCLRQHLLAGDGGAAALAIRKAFAAQLHVDADTLQPAPGEQWQALLVRVQRCGLAGEWTQDEHARLATVRLLRGVAPAANR